jgi:hypothetical protein
MRLPDLPRWRSPSTWRSSPAHQRDIGRGIAVALGRAGAALAFVDIDDAALAGTIEELDDVRSGLRGFRRSAHSHRSVRLMSPGRSHRRKWPARSTTSGPTASGNARAIRSTNDGAGPSQADGPARWLCPTRAPTADHTRRMSALLGLYALMGGCRGRIDATWRVCHGAPQRRRSRSR